MSPAEQVNAVQRFGYTAREASFLVTAALHSGYFLTRQFILDRGESRRPVPSEDPRFGAWLSDQPR
jgi:hypothetical protein